MLFRKKLAIWLLGASGISGGWYLAKEHFLKDKNQISDWEQLIQLTKNIQDVEVDSSIDPNIKTMAIKENKFLYSLFSTNLKTFAEHFHVYFYKWAVYEWSNWFLNNTKKNSFPATKNALLKNLKGKDKAGNFSPENWNQNNNLITSSFEALNKEFLNLTLGNIWRKSDGSDIGIEANQLKAYEDEEYAKILSEFQKFVFEEWMARNKPLIMCTKKWNINSKFKSKLFQESHGDFERPDVPNFDFPDYSDVSQEIKNFHNFKKCDKELFTINQLSKMDGREIDAFISQYFSEIKTDNTAKDKLKPGSDKDGSIDDVNKFFIDSCNDCKIKSPNENLIDKNGDLKDINSSKKFLSFRRAKWNSSGDVVYARTSSGITFMHLDENNKNGKLKKALLENKNTIEGFDLSRELKAFFSENAGELLGKYFSQNDSEKKKIFDIKSKNPSLNSLIKDIWPFSEELKRNKSHWQTMNRLSLSVKQYSQVTFDSSKKPNFSAGLGDPLWMERKLNSTSSASNSSGSFLDAISKDNDGTFNLLSKYYNPNEGEWKMSKLHTHAQTLKKSISKYMDTFVNSMTFKHSNKQKSYFLGDYILDNVYFQFLSKDGGNFLKKTTMGLMMANEMKFNYFKNDIDGFIQNWISKIKTSDEAYIKNSLKEAISNVYYGTKYLSEPIELRINYGGFKFTKTDDKCSRFIGDSGGSGNCSSYVENQREWINKLNNYWNMKNFVFQDSGYELGSEDSLNYLKFLFSFYHFGKQNFSNLRSFLSRKIPNDRHGALVWVDKVTKVSDDSDIGVEENGAIKEMKKYFKNTKLDEIFNPFFNRTMEVSETKTSNLSTEHLGAYAIVGPSKKQELFGFQGIYIEGLNTANLPNHIKKSIFYKFQNANPKNNKNYLVNNSESNKQYGLGFGKLNGDDKSDFYSKVDSFATETFLKSFLMDMMPDFVDEIWTNNDFRNLNELKQKIKNKLEEQKYSSELKNLSTRFAGMLQNPEVSESMHKEKVFYIPETGDKEQGNLVYIIQVNKYDFENNFSNFVKTIGTDTFIKMILKLSMDENISKGIIFKHFIYKGITV